MTTLILARHGETDWNAERRWQGHADTPLNDRGRDQARELAKELAPVELDAAYASDLRRALETAEIAVAGRGMEVVALAELRERSFGSWEGLNDDEVPLRFPDDHSRWKAGDGHGAHDAEPYADMARRVETAVERIVARHPESTVLVVAHGGTLRMIHALAEGVDFASNRERFPAIPNCAVSRIAVREGVLTRID